ncbi:hypothetical protein LTR37_019171 [Vermiconidia calcicola]|uniref:Uncharacterized protein n=1 Tax=Vermiconidia calcicola TaxID=1690605 RepID=A0ACC3MHZ7_9PEZI|nr:hypothetical protein LTR37_019171 [Vermiconidia calcicola]
MLAVPGCGERDCTECTSDTPQLCARGHHSGIGQDGFYAPYGTIDVRGAVHVPEGVTPLQAAVATDAVLTAYHAITRRAEVKKHQTVFLFGLGGLGFNALQVVCKAIGARVIVSDIRQERLDAAAQLGVPPEDIVPVGKAVQEFVAEKRLTIDTTLDFVGEKQTFEDAQHIGETSLPDLSLDLYDGPADVGNSFNSVRIAGKMVCVGTLSPDNVMHMKLGVRKRLSIIFSYGGQREDLEALLELMARKVIMPQVEEGRLGDFPRWLQDPCDGKVRARVALTPD